MSAVKEKQQRRKHLVLKILFEQGGKTLSELAVLTDISLPVITKIVNELKKEKFLTEKKIEKHSNAGRPPVIYKLNGSAGYVAGIELGRINTNYVLLDLEKNIVIEKKEKKNYLNESEKGLDQLERKLETIIRSANLDWNKLLGIGISIPGIVDSEKGASRSYFEKTEGPIEEILIKKFEKPVKIENDSRSLALGELWFGSAKNNQNALCINFGWGLGLGVIVNEKLLEGRNGLAGEFGHIQIVNNGKLCYCGKRGCLETVSSGMAIEEEAQTKLKNGVESILRKGNKDLEKISNLDILKAANIGDQFSIEILERAAAELGRGIGILINIFNPGKIIIGGEISKVADYILDTVKTNAMKHSLVYLNQDVKFEISKLGNSGAALGIARHTANTVI